MDRDLTEEFDHARKQNEKIAAEEYELLMGQISGSKAGMLERGNGVSLESKKKSALKEEERKERNQFLTTEILNDYLRKLEVEIHTMEAEFRKRDGEEWREKLALRILGENDIPQIQDGESIKDYRERLEPILIAELLNANGSIKSEYENHPELSAYAEWAQKKHHLNRAKVYGRELEDINTTPERREEIYGELEQGADAQERVFAQRKTTPGSVVAARIQSADDATDDSIAQADKSTARNDFFNSP